MLPELKWEIALYLDLPEIESVFPQLLANEIFLAALFERDFPDITDSQRFWEAEYDKELYGKLFDMRELSKKIENRVFQMDLSEKIYQDHQEWKNLIYKEYFESKYYFMNGIGFAVDIDIYMTETILKEYEYTMNLVLQLFSQHAPYYGEETIEKMVDNLIETREYKLLDYVGDTRMWSSDFTEKIAYFESTIGYRKKLQSVKKQFLEIVDQVKQFTKKV